MDKITKWHLYARLIAIQAIVEEIDMDVWNCDDALERTRSYLAELAGDIEVALDHIKVLNQEDD